MTIDTDAILALDSHVHVETDGHGNDALDHTLLSGWALRRFPAQLVRAVSGPLRDKALFGSDFPLITPDRWLTEFAHLDIRPEVRPLVLKDNAIRVLGLQKMAGRAG